MRSAVEMERYTVQQGEPLYVRDGVREIIRRITKLDEYMAYGTDSELWNELVEQTLFTRITRKPKRYE